MSTLACVALAALAESAPSLTGPIVKLPNGDGSVRGDRLADLNVNRYLGIPFAAPPVGNGRWASPEPPKPWAPTVRPALHWAPNCAQLSPPAWQTMYHNKSAYSEDCLYLNVFAPEPMPGEQETLDYPVMVWIHGGGYAYGGAHDSELDGTQLADMANVVVVTIQYRLDVFGFLGAESLRSRSSDNSTGNWAMQDQRMALRWVKENIGAFRGNASQITLFGESAGAGGVSNHVAMPKSWGLFDTAIMQSGGFQRWVAKPLAWAQKNFDALLKSIACNDVECLVGKSTAELLEHAEGQRLPSTDSWDGCQWSPVIDGVELKAHPYELVLKGEVVPDVPLILGSTADEGTSFIGYNRTGDDPDAPEYDMTAAEFKKWAARIFGQNVTARIEELYPVGNGQHKDHFIAAENVVSDYMMWCPVRRIARAHAASKSGGRANTTFVYIFSEVPGLNDESKDHEGVFHGE